MIIQFKKLIMQYGLHNICRSKVYGNHIKDREMEVYQREALQYMCMDILVFKESP